MSYTLPLISTKIRIPRRSQSLLRRQRLVDFIHSNIQQKVILIAAGAGYGKTSLLIDYAHDTDLPVCWYSLDAQDSYLPTFLEYLVASIRQRFPQFGESVLQAVRANPLEAVEPLVRLCIHEIETAIDRYFVIILDDYHTLDVGPVTALIDGLLRYLPEHCHVILASRGIPRGLTLTRLAARQEIVGLGVEHLRFDADEIGQLLHSLGKVDLTPAQIQVLAERSEGWITGILLAARTNWTGTAGDVLRLSGATGAVFDYMATEVLACQSAETQRFLLGSALFSEMTPPLCDALLDISNSAQILRGLAAQSLFTYALDAEGNWYQYHQLFREFLVAKLEREAPEEHRRLRLKQAEIMAHHGHWERAIDGYMAAQAFDRAADALEVVVKDAFDAGRWETLKTWIDALPEAERAKHPRLLLFRAKIHAETGNLNQAVVLLKRSYQAYLERQDDVGAARALVQSAIVHRFRGNLRDAMRDCRAALDMVGERDNLTATQAHHNLGICHILQGEFTEGIGELELASRLAQDNGDEINAAYIANDMGSAETMRGQLTKARQNYHQALAYWRKIGHASASAVTLQNLGVLHHYLGQYAEAETYLQEGLAKAREAADVRVQVHALASQGDLYRDTARYDEALLAYQQAMTIALEAQLTQLAVYLLDAMSNTYRLKGDSEQAKRSLDEAFALIPENEMGYELGLCQLSLGALALQQGQLDEAQRCLSHAKGLFVQHGAKRDLGRALLHSAALARLRGEDAQACADLSEVARLVAELGSHQFIVAEGPFVAALMRYAEEQGVRGLDYARIRAELAQITPSPPLVRATTERQRGPSLEFLALNGGQVLKEGHVVTDWESTSARFMVFFFLSHPEGLHRDQVIEALWPEVTQAKGNSLFHSTVYRLRRALFKDIIVYERGVYYMNPECNYRYDVMEFRQLAKLGRGHDDAARVARERALELYRSPFLQECEDSWCYEIRQSLQEEMLTILLLQAQHLAKQGLWSEAEALYLRALSVDSYDERAHRGIMWCRAENDDRAGAIRQFRECVRLLRTELDVEPSAETRALYEAIVAGTPVPMPS